MTERPIRSLHINTERTWRGGEKQTLLLVEGLLARGHTADLICPPGSPLAERARRVGVKVFEISMRGEADVKAILKIRRVMREGDYEICQLHTSHAHSLGVLARGFRGWPKTIVARRVDFSIYRRSSLGLNWIKYRFGVDRYFAISAAIRAVLIRDGIPAQKIHVVHSGVPTLSAAESSRAEIRTQYGIPLDVPLVVNVAHLASHKGQVVLIEALAAMIRAGSDVSGLIVGEGGERGILESRLEELEVTERIHLAGFQTDITAHLQAADIFCMPSLQEGLCTSILDALSIPLPVVASNTGGIPEIVEDNVTGLLAIPGDIQSLQEQLTRLLQDPDRAAQLAQAGHEKVRRDFSIDNTVETSLEHYRALIQGAA